MKRPGILILAVFIVSTNLATRADFEFQEVARTGDTIPSATSPIASFGHWVSINDAGQVAFKLVRQDGSEAIARATPNANGVYDQFDIIESGDGDFRRFSDEVGINANGDVSYRLRTATSPVNLSIRRNTTSVAGTGSSLHFSNVMSKTDISKERDGMVCFRGAVLDASYRIRDQIRKGDGRDGNRVNDTVLIAAEPEFTSLEAHCGINDFGTTVFTGAHPSLGSGIFVGDGGVRKTVATTTTGFTATGTQPSIVNNGLVGFYGMTGGEEGIYIWREGQAPELKVAIGSPVQGINPGSRVVLNNNCDVAFRGTTANGGVPALYRDCGSGPEVIVETGDEIKGTAPVDGLELWDGLNLDGKLAFWLHHSDTTESILVAEGCISRGSCPTAPGRVLFDDFPGTPINLAEVQAYKLTGPHSYQLLGQPVYTDEDGRYQRPVAFTDPQYDNDTLGIRAEISYFDPGEGGLYSIVNFPNNDPFPPKGSIGGTEVIRFPLPVVMQAGLFGGVDRGTWTAFGQYLRSNSAGTTYLEYPKFEGSIKVPSFLTFVMPSNDTETWGYHDGLPLSHQPHDMNANLLDAFVSHRMRDALDTIIPDAQLRNQLPINLCAHSMGGIITRGWMHDYQPKVARYVSFDGVHGGTSFLGFGRFALGFAEWYMNGVNPEDDRPPIPFSYSSSMWNYWHTVSSRNTNNLLISASTDWLVEPNCSAFGVGRTMRGVVGGRPNGHKARFIGGVEWHTNASHGGTHDDPNVIHQAARFLTAGSWPEGSYRSGSADECQNEPLRMSQQGVSGNYWTKLTVPAGEIIETPVYIDGNPSLGVTVFVEGIGGRFDLLDPAGESLVPPELETFDFGGGRSMMFSVPTPPMGLAALQFEAGASPEAVYVGMSFDNERLFSVEAPDEAMPTQTAATIAASIVDGQGSVIVGAGGTVEVTVTLPDGTTEMLNLFDDGSHQDGAAGDGVYGNAFGATSLGGRYLVDAHAVVALGAEMIERTATGMFVVDSSPASLVAVTAERPVDETVDGKWDRLEFDIDVLINEPGQYQVRAVLEDSGEQEISQDYQLFEIPSGTTTHVATLHFDGGTLVAHGVPGPWTLARIQLFDNMQAMLVDMLDDWPTASYALSDFTTPPEPVLTIVVPDYGPVQGGNEIVLQGAHFEHVSGITLGSVPLPTFDVWSNSAIRLTVPLEPALLSGSVDLILTTNWATKRFSDAYRYWPRLGDLNGDNQVDHADNALFVLCMTGPQSSSRPDGCAQGTFGNSDLDADGTVDLRDYRILAIRFEGNG